MDVEMIVSHAVGKDPGYLFTKDHLVGLLKGYRAEYSSIQRGDIQEDFPSNVVKVW
jgi:hypothetical protein